MIIGLSGYARVGKTEAAIALGMDGWRVKAFSETLREFLYTLNPIVNRLIEPDKIYNAVYVPPRRLQDVINQHGWDGYKKTPYNDEIRRLIQTLGTDCGRAILGESVWVNATMDSYDDMGKFDFSNWKRIETHNWVIHDVRFPNEAQAIIDRGGKIIRINKPGVGPVNDHESETALDNWPWDSVIHNDGSIDDLHRKIRFTAEVTSWKGV